MATTRVIKRTQYGLGTAGHGDLQEQFATVLDDYDPEAALKLAQEGLDGLQTGNPDIGPVDMDYGNSPLLEKFVPDRGWPAGGTTNPRDITPGPAPRSSGAGSTESPATGAARVSKQKIGDYILGKSSNDS